MTHSASAGRLLCVLVWCASGCGEPDGKPAPQTDDDDVVSDTDPGTPATYDPARVLTASELRRTVEAVFGEPLADDLWLPADSFVDGFDNQIAGSSMSSARLGWYDGVVRQVAERAVRPATVRPRFDHVELIGGTDAATTGHYPTGWAGRVEIPAAGVYTVSVDATFRPSSPINEAIVAIDGVARAFLVWDDPTPVLTHSVDLELTAGHHQVGVWGAETAYAADGLIAEYETLGPVTLDGPNDAEPVNTVRGPLVPCDLDADTAACTRAVLARVLPVAWRRPATVADLDALVAVAAATLSAGGSPDDALVDALYAMMLSPNFLMHLELVPALADASPQWALAARLSFFLWSGPPDDALRAHAEVGDLSDPAVLDAQIARMLADPRAEALFDGLATEWFELTRVQVLAPGSDEFPGFTRDLGASMREQAERFVRSYFLGDRDLVGLISDPVAWADPTLAAWLDLPIPRGGEGDVSMADAGRYGLLGLPAIQTMLSTPTRTSPTRRGAWVLRHLLCAPPEDPPPNVPALASTPTDLALPMSLRIAEHARDPACAGCHAMMDPIGLALENFDGAGHWRDDDHGYPVDGVGTLAGGDTVEGLAGLVDLMVGDPQFERCVVTTTFSWALGRAPRADEASRVTSMQAAWVEAGRTFPALVRVLAQDPAFRAGTGAP